MHPQQQKQASMIAGSRMSADLQLAYDALESLCCTRAHMYTGGHKAPSEHR